MKLSGGEIHSRLVGDKPEGASRDGEIGEPVEAGSRGGIGISASWGSSWGLVLEVVAVVVK